MSDQRTRIHVNELRIGMFICDLDIPWTEFPFPELSTGFIVQSREQLAHLRSCCTYVFIDVKKQKRQLGSIPTSLTKETDRKAFVEAFAKATESYRSTSSLVKTVMEDLRFGNQLNSQVMKEAVTDCVNNVLDNSDTMHLLTQLKNMDEYTSEHSLNVCILSILLGKHLKFTPEKLNRLGICGLLHDMGKSKIPLEILNKNGPLTDEEMEIMKTHSELGRDILLESQDIDQEAIDVAHSHHERLNGSGYPRGLSSKEISTFTRIVAIVDAYDAITSDRVYQQGRLHLEALEILIKGRQDHFDAKLVMQFIECIGVFPVGNPVEMTNGEVAMVIESNPANKSKPKVLMILDANKKPQKERLIDLADPNAAVDLNGNPYKLFKVIKQDSYGINLRAYHEQGLLANALLA